MPSNAQISQLAKRLQAAADQEDWSTAAALLAQLDQQLRSPSLPVERSTLENALQAVHAALADTQRRRDEISTLVRALGGASLRSDEAV